jgi:hypothetical protein
MLPRSVRARMMLDVLDNRRLNALRRLVEDQESEPRRGTGYRQLLLLATRRSPP